MEEQNALRMYFFVMYNLSGIQKGIQAGHAALEYADVYGNTMLYREFIDNHKTFILLDGGGSSEMMTRCDELKAMGISFMSFVEPDLNNSISAIAFILPEHQYDFKVPKWMECCDLDSNTDYKIYNYIRGFKLASN